MHPLLLPPARRMEGVIRMPSPQNAGAAFTQQLLDSMMSRDALRKVKTTASNRIALGPLSSPQMFVTEPAGGTNTPESMAPGAHKMNARRLVSKTRGASAGI